MVEAAEGRRWRAARRVAEPRTMPDIAAGPRRRSEIPEEPRAEVWEAHAAHR